VKGTEFRCKREYLGLPAAWLARKMEVDLRTVQRWEYSGAGDVPEYAEKAINYLWAGAARSVSVIALEQLKKKVDHVKLPPLAIPAGDSELPASWHRMIAVRVAERTGQEITAA
jgi:hypothetical protein